jgi:hypothetical protein
MTESSKFLAINLRRVFRHVLGYEDKFETTSEHCTYFNQAASDLIKDGLESDSPFAVSRFGHSELRALLTYLHIREKGFGVKKIVAFIKGERVEPWWSDNTLKIITHNAGIFPREVGVIEDFSRLLLEDIKQIDVLGSWLGGEKWVKPMMQQAKFMRFHDFYHFLHERPWTESLKGKRVLVIHPFSKSIEGQFKVKDKIFSGVHRLPDFELITYTSVQSIAGNRPKEFKDWFHALEFMKSEISQIDFDVALVGCGAYGMPLAASIKRDMKKKAIHLGGNTQILFGIKGSRWENDPEFSHIFNSYWTRPLREETPAGHGTIDNNCYW